MRKRKNQQTEFDVFSPVLKQTVDIQGMLLKAVRFHQIGSLQNAEKIYKEILERKPDHPDALHLHGLVAYQTGENAIAVDLIKQAIKNNPENPFYHNNLGAALREAGKLEEAVSSYQDALRIKPDYAEAHYNMGSACQAQGKIDQATSFYRKATNLNPGYVDAYINLSAAHNEKGQGDEAISCCRKAIQLSPKNAEAYNNMGNAMKAKGKLNEAIACYWKSIALDSNNVEAHCNIGSSFQDLGRLDDAISCYQKALIIQPGCAKAYNNMGTAFQSLGNLNKAAVCYQKALKIRPDDPEALHNLGNAFQNLDNLGDAISTYKKAVLLKPDLVETYISMGVAFRELGRPEEATSCFRKAIGVKPEYSKSYAHLVHQLQHVCAWHDLKSLADKLDALTQASLKEGTKPDEMPFLNITRHADPALNLAVAKAWSQDLSGSISKWNIHFSFSTRGDNGSKIRLGYLSNNFRNHPTAHQVLGLFGCHNREEFEVFCYSYGEDDGSIYRDKIKRDCDKFVDIRELSHIDAARKINQDKVDILVDLAGFMKGSRLNICALRPAPIQVRYLGMAGTTGANFIDYIIADRIVAPRCDSSFYTENIVYMPHCYQVNNNMQSISNKSWARKDFGLPEDSPIFCSFNTNYKIDDVMFNVWMSILHKVPKSVLWVLSGGKTVEENLKNEAERCEVDPARIVFSDKLPKDEHLARLKLADLSLDTRVVNGAASTSDALWAGIPVITLKGRHFASRMSASILTAIGLPELITYNLEEYENLAVRLASSNELKIIKDKLAQNRNSAPLFDTPQFVRDLEQVYKTMRLNLLAGKNSV